MELSGMDRWRRGARPQGAPRIRRTVESAPVVRPSPPRASGAHRGDERRRTVEATRVPRMRGTGDFDIVIPVGPNDRDIIQKQLAYTKKNVIGYRNIYLICYDPSISARDCVTIDEKIFPFTIDTVSKFHGKVERNGWYLQQLLKLYAGSVIPGISTRYLVIDSDTFFLKPTTFVENDRCLYNFGTEYNKHYFSHMSKLDGDLVKVDKNKSGICHHMMFETKYIDELITKVETNHKDTFFNVFLRLVTDKTPPVSPRASEYEIYFNYMLKNHSDKIKIRKLNWKNTNRIVTDKDYDYISYHWYKR